MQPRAPELSLPSIPPELMQLCSDLEPLKDGQLASLYLQMMRDAAMYHECKRRQAALVAVVKYQEQTRADYAQSQSQSKPTYWKFW